jgi:hypothetical protein
MVHICGAPYLSSNDDAYDATRDPFGKFIAIGCRQLPIAGSRL